jgi:mannose-6-phosphate isomerase class I
MAIALTTDAALNCPSEMGYTVPFATLELTESPESGPVRAQAEVHTIVSVIDGIVYVVAGEDEWVLTSGDSASIAAGVPYRRWNAGDEQARWLEVYCTAA